MKKLFLLLFFNSLFCYVFAQETSKTYVYFDSDQWTLTERSKDELTQFFESSSTKAFQSIQLSGHTDAKGDEAYNLELSKRRVQAVKMYVLSLAIEESILQIDYFGETRPVATNEIEKDRQSNRRVEVLLTFVPTVEKSTDSFVKEVEEVVTKESPLEEVLEELETAEESLSDQLAVFKKQPEYFHIANGRDTMLQGAEGTILFFKANSFDARQLINDSIKIELTEYYSAADLILNNLHTQSHHRLLETQGMIHLQAYSNGRELQLKSGKRIKIFIPNVDSSKDFQLFKGIENSNDVNWVRDSRAATETCFDVFANRIGYLYLVTCDCRTSFSRWICAHVTKKHKKKAERELEQRREKQQQEAMAQNNQIDFSEMQNKMAAMDINAKVEVCMVFTTLRMGWINCDRFLSLPRKELTTVKVKDKEGEEASMTMVFKKMKSKMRGSISRKGVFKFKNIPKGKRVWIIGIKKIEGTFMLAIQPHNTSNKLIDNLVYKPVSKTELAASLDDLGW